MYSKKVQDKIAILSVQAEESFVNIRTVKAFSNENDEIKRFFRVNDEAYSLAIKRSLLFTNFIAIAMLLLFCSMALIMLYGGHLYE